MAHLTKNHIKKIGEILACEDASPDERKTALEELSRWREAHLAPFQTMLELLESIACNAGSDFVLFGRLKRIDTIEGKLRRPGSTHKLNTMDDIAGCRLILPSIEDMRRVEALLLEKLGSSVCRTRDYIKTPKESGYRGIHIIGKLDSPAFGLTDLRVEVQLRTEVQHAWASTLELYDVLTSSGLKFGQGDEQQLRFFRIVSELFAGDEMGAKPPNRMHLAEELKLLENSIHVVRYLEGANDSVVPLGNAGGINETTYCLIRLDYETQEAFIEAYPQAAAPDVVVEYAKQERLKQHSRSTDVLMLKASSFETLKRALPNYFSDISFFLTLIAPYLK